MSGVWAGAMGKKQREADFAASTRRRPTLDLTSPPAAAAAVGAGGDGEAGFSWDYTAARAYTRSRSRST